MGPNELEGVDRPTPGAEAHRPPSRPHCRAQAQLHARRRIAATEVTVGDEIVVQVRSAGEGGEAECCVQLGSPSRRDREPNVARQLRVAERPAVGALDEDAGVACAGCFPVEPAPAEHVLDHGYVEWIAVQRADFEERRDVFGERSQRACDLVGHRRRHAHGCLWVPLLG